MTSTERRLVVDLNAVAPAWRVTSAALAQLRAAMPAGFSVHVVQHETSSDGDGGVPPSGEVMAAIRNAEIYFGYGISRELFLAGGQLRWVHTATAGVGSSLFSEMRVSPVLFTNSAAVYGPTIAEHVLAGVLHFVRSLDRAIEAQVNGQWIKQELTGVGTNMRELAGSRVLVYGTGGIGTEVARRFTALGCHCIGVRRRPELGAPSGFDRVAGIEELEAELTAAEILILAAPGTVGTTGVLNRERIRLLPRGAIVVNVARGSLADEGALVEALESGQLRGVFLDVTLQEPLPSGSPLWRQRGVLITPHVSAVAPRSFWEREMELFLDNWQRYAAGDPLRNLVDKQAGY